MKVLNRFIFIIILLSLCFFSCKKTEISDSQEYLMYIANPENGLVKQKSVAGIKIIVKYLPEDYLGYNVVKDMGALTKTYKDSVIKSYEHSLTFMVNVGPDDHEEFDVTRVGVSSYQEFAERIEQMAFNAQEWISVEVKNNKYKPVIARMENINAIEKSRNFIVVFNSSINSELNIKKNDVCLSYDDELFNTGLNKFIFQTEDIQKLPKFKF